MHESGIVADREPKSTLIVPAFWTDGSPLLAAPGRVSPRRYRIATEELPQLVASRRRPPPWPEGLSLVISVLHSLRRRWPVR